MRYGSQPYRNHLGTSEYVGLEFDTPENRTAEQADFFYDGTTFSFENDAFDSILCTEVLEHVFEPERFVQEMMRVLKPGGKLLMTVPFAWDENEQPWDYGRYSSFGLTHLLTKHGFHIVKHVKSGVRFRALAQLRCTTVWKSLGLWERSPTLVRYAVSSLLAPIHMAGAVLQSPFRNADLYLDNIVLAEKKDTK